MCLMKRKDWSDVFVNNSSILCLAISYDNEYLFMGDKDGQLVIFFISKNRGNSVSSIMLW